MLRREFIALLGSAAVWSSAARAQPQTMRRIGILVSLGAEDRQGQARHAAFVQRLKELGWIEDRNVRIDTRWGAGLAADIRKYAAELVTSAPDVILAAGGSTVGPLLQATNTIPIVFTGSRTRLAADWSRASRGQAAMQPALPRSNTTWAANGWSCSKKLRLL